MGVLGCQSFAQSHHRPLGTHGDWNPGIPSLGCFTVGSREYFKKGSQTWLILEKRGHTDTAASMPKVEQTFGLLMGYFRLGTVLFPRSQASVAHTFHTNFQSDKWIQPSKANTFWLEQSSFLISCHVSYINHQPRGTISESILYWEILPECHLVLALLSLLLIIMIYRAVWGGTAI